jgi:hypothetical protein
VGILSDHAEVMLNRLDTGSCAAVQPGMILLNGRKFKQIALVMAKGED